MIPVQATTKIAAVEEIVRVRWSTSDSNRKKTPTRIPQLRFWEEKPHGRVAPQLSSNLKEQMQNVRLLSGENL
jgi:hypothetical protein